MTRVIRGINKEFPHTMLDIAYTTIHRHNVILRQNHFNFTFVDTSKHRNDHIVRAQCFFPEQNLWLINQTKTFVTTGSEREGKRHSHASNRQNFVIKFECQTSTIHYSRSLYCNFAVHVQ